MLFFLWWILKFLQPGGFGESCGKREFFFLTIVFHQCNNTTITYQQFYSCLRWYFTHSSYCYVMMFFSPLLKNGISTSKNASFPSVLMYVAETNTILYGIELPMICNFDLFPVKNTTQTKGNCLCRELNCLCFAFSISFQ